MRSILKDNRGCFGGGGKAPSPQPPPAPAPVPTASQSQVVPTNRDALNRLRYGMASTIKTPLGMTGSGTNLSGVNNPGKTKLGA